MRLDGGEMSLINEVLRNLEAKRPDELAGNRLQREIRPLPPAPRARSGRLWLLLCLLVAALGAAGWYWQEAWVTRHLAEPPVAAAEMQSVPVLPSEPVAAGLSQNLRMAQELLALPPEPEPPAQPVVADILKPAMALARTPEPEPAPAPVVQPSTASTTPMVATPASIEKSPVLATPRDRADAEWRRAEAALAGGRGEEARAALQAALRHDPGHVQVRQVLLRHLLEVRRLDEAVRVLQEGLELQPAQTGWAMSLARLHLERGELPAADAVLARSQAFAESQADYAGFQGHLKTGLGQHRQAAAHYQRATRLAPNDGRWWLGLGLALESDGRLPEGREALRRALSSGNLPADLASVAEQHLR